MRRRRRGPPKATPRHRSRAGLQYGAFSAPLLHGGAQRGPDQGPKRERHPQAQTEPETRREGEKTEIPRKICKARGNGEGDVQRRARRPLQKAEIGTQEGERQRHGEGRPGRVREIETRIQSQRETETGSLTDTNRQIPREADSQRHARKCREKHAQGDTGSERHRLREMQTEPERDPEKTPREMPGSRERQRQGEAGRVAGSPRVQGHGVAGERGTGIPKRISVKWGWGRVRSLRPDTTPSPLPRPTPASPL